MKNVKSLNIKKIAEGFFYTSLVFLGLVFYTFVFYKIGFRGTLIGALCIVGINLLIHLFNYISARISNSKNKLILFGISYSRFFIMIILATAMLWGSYFIIYRYIYLDYKIKSISSKSDVDKIGESSIEAKEALIGIDTSIKLLNSLEGRIKIIANRSNELKVALENEVEHLNKANTLLHEINKQRDNNNKLIKDIRAEIGGERESKLQTIINYFMVFLLIALSIITEKLRKKSKIFAKKKENKNI